MGFCLGNRGGGRKLIVKVINLIKKKIFNLTKMVNKTEDQIKIKKYIFFMIIDERLHLDLENESFDLSNYLIEISKIRRKKFNFSIIKKKLSISDKQLEILELGNIDFLPFPYNYHITKQYVENVDPEGVFKVKKEFFSNTQKFNRISNDNQNVGSYIYTNILSKL